MKKLIRELSEIKDILAFLLSFSLTFMLFFISWNRGNDKVIDLLGTGSLLCTYILYRLIRQNDQPKEDGVYVDGEIVKKAKEEILAN